MSCVYNFICKVFYTMLESINVCFNFDEDEITVSSFNLGNQHVDITTKISNKPSNYSDFSYIEIPLNKIMDKDIPPGSKWIFSWKQYNKREQYLKLEQYVPFPISDVLFNPSKYDAWSTLESWSYNCNPSRGTNQSNKIMHKVNSCFARKYNLIMEVKGSPAVANWKTTI